MIEPWSVLFAAFALLLAVAQFWIEHADRVSDREARAWQLVTTKAPGNSGKIAALEYLNREDGFFCLGWLNVGCVILLKPRTELVEIDLSPRNNTDSRVFLQKVDLANAVLRSANLSHAFLLDADLSNADLWTANLSHAFLRAANLSDAFLLEANLSHAFLPGADLSDAFLSKANLTDADLVDADLTGANLTGANLTDADLSLANLSGTYLLDVDLRFLHGLRQSQLDQACVDELTQLPEGLSVQLCDNIR